MATIINCINKNVTDFVLRDKYKEKLSTKADVKRELNTLKLQAEKLTTKATKTAQFSIAEDLTEADTTEYTDKKGRKVFNRIKANMQSKPVAQLMENTLHHFFNFQANIHNIVLGSYKDFEVFAQKYLTPRSTTETGFTLLESFDSYTNKFSKELHKIHKAYEGAKQGIPSYFNLTDVAHDFVDEKGQLRPNLVAAIAAGAFKWQSTRADSILNNDEDDIAGLFGLTRDAYVPLEVQDALSDIGIPDQNIYLALGNMIYPLLGIEPITDKAGMLQEERTKIALGMTAAAVLESQGILKLNYVYTGRTQATKVNPKTGKVEPVKTSSLEYPDNRNEAFGLNWADRQLKEINEDETSTDDSTFTPADLTTILVDPSNVIIGAQQTKYYTIAHDVTKQEVRVADPLFAEMRDRFNAAPTLWDDLFGQQYDDRTILWEKPKGKNERKLQRSNQKATDKQNKLLNKYEQNGQKAIGSVLNFLLMMTDNAKDFAFGNQNLFEQNTTHKSNRKRKNSKVYDNESSWGAIVGWIKEAEQLGKLNDVFYVPSRLMLHGRAMMTGIINRQGDKIHRYAFTDIAFKHTFKMNDVKGFNQFILGLAKTFDIEYSKKGSIDRVITAFTEHINQPDLAKAVQLTRQFLNDFDGNIEDLNPDTFVDLQGENKDLITALAKVMHDGDDAVAVLQGVIEYSKFLNAVEKGDKSFTTHVAAEADGMSNGVMLMLINFIHKVTDTSALITMLRNSGWVFHKDQVSVEKLLSHPEHNRHQDIYQHLTFTWQKYLSTIRKQTDPKQLKQIDAVTALVGQLTEPDGSVTSAMRKMGKLASLPTSFGSSPQNIVNKFIYENIIQDNIYNVLEEIAVLVKTNKIEEAQNKLIELNKSFKTLTGHNLLKDIDKSLKTEILLNRVLTKTEQTSIEKAIFDGHGKALEQAIFEVYGPAMRTRKLINVGIQYSVEMYNGVFEVEFSKLVQEKEGAHNITVDEFKALTDSLTHLLPVLKTPFGGQIDLSVVGTRTTLEDMKLGFVHQTFEGKIARKKQQLTYKGKHNNPGVRAFVLSIHNLDAAIALALSGGDTNILNVYDGFYANVSKISDIARSANDHLYNFLKDYDVAQELSDTTKNSQKALQTWINQNKDLVPALHNVLGKTSSQVISDLYNKNKEEPVKLTIEKFLKELNTLTKYATKKKNEILSKVVRVNHYNYFEGDYETNNEQANEVLGVGTQNIDTAAEQRVSGIGPQIYGSKDAREIEDNPDMYELTEQVDQQNIVDVYHRVKLEGPRELRDTETHDNYLQHLLHDMIIPALDHVKAQTTLFTTLKSKFETQGIFKANPTENQIYLAIQDANVNPASGIHGINNGIRRSAGTTMIHEFLHVITKHGLASNFAVRNQLTKLVRLTEKMLNEKYGNEAFRLCLNDPTIDLSDPAYVDEIQAAKARYDHIFTNKTIINDTQVNPTTGVVTNLSRTHKLAEFVALGLSDPNILREFQSLELSKDYIELRDKNTWKGIRGRSIQATVLNIFSKILEIIKNNYTKANVDKTVASELKQLTLALAQLEVKNKSMVLKALERESMLVSKAGQKADKHIKKAFKQWPLLKKFYGIRMFKKAIYDAEHSIGTSIRRYISSWKSFEEGYTRSLFNEIVGGSPNHQNIYDLRNIRTARLDGPRNTIIQTEMEVLNSIFPEPLTTEEKQHIFKVLFRTDISTLHDHFDMRQIARMITDESNLNTNIADILHKLGSNVDLKQFKDYYQREVEALGYHMVTGVATENAANIHNIRAIAELKGTMHEHKLTQDQADIAISLLDQLATMYALKYTAKKEKTTLANLIEKYHRKTEEGIVAVDQEPIELVILAHKVVKLESEKALFKDDPYRSHKGYTKNIINPYHDVANIEAHEVDHYKNLGYTILEQPLATDSSDPVKKTLYMAIGKNVLRGADRMTGVASFTSNQRMGTNLTDMEYSQTDVNTIMQAKQQIIDSVFTGTYSGKPKRSTSTLVPQLDIKGNISNYRYMMSHHVKETYLDQTLAFDAVLSQMRGQILDKVETPKINKELITELYKLYQTDAKLFPNAYVEISPYSTDPELRDFYYMLPQDAHKDIRKIWGTNKMYIHKDLLAISFGFKKYSIMESYHKDSKDMKFMERMVIGFTKAMFGKYAAKILNAGEQSMLSATNIAKTNIIVRNPSITGGNFISNIFYLRSRGVSNSFILKHSKDATVFGLQYQAEKLQVFELNRKLDILQATATPDQTKIQKLLKEKLELEESMLYNPTREFIESGGMPDIVDDYDTQAKETGYEPPVEEALEKGLEKIGKKSKKLETATRAIFLTKDREEFKVLNNAVKMTDFVARYVLYRHYTHKNMGDNKMTHKQAMRSVIKEFINFNIPTHRMIQYSNDIGLWWFSKYQLRVFNSMFISLIDRPTETVYNIAVANLTGASNIFCSIPGVTKGIFQGFGNAFSVLTGSVPQIAPMNITENTLQTIFD